MIYTIGQILYVVLKKEMTVYPMIVAEVVTKRTLEGETVVYMVRAGKKADNGDEMLISISDVEGEIFDSSETARKTLTDRATGQISKLVENAVSKAREWYPNGKEHSTLDASLLARKPKAAVKKPQQLPQMNPPEQDELEEAGDIIELENGQKVRVRSVQLPDVLKG